MNGGVDRRDPADVAQRVRLQGKASPSARNHSQTRRADPISANRAKPSRLASADEILRLARRTTSRELALAARSCRVLDLVELGRIDEADRDLVAYGRLASELRVPRYRWRAQFYRGMRLILAGRFTEAEESVGRILDVERSFRPEERPARLRPTVEAVADVRDFVLEGRRFATACGGLLLCLPDLVRLATRADALTRLARAYRCPPADVRHMPSVLVGTAEELVTELRCREHEDGLAELTIGVPSMRMVRRLGEDVMPHL